jgi:predicted ATPase/DNA-binding SARP family transcriptional activator
MSTLRIRLLGDFRLSYTDAPTSPINSPRLQSLLAYLVLHPDAPQPRQALAFQLWPDTSEAQARTNLRQLVHGLKQALPDADQFIVTSAQTLQWRSDASFQLDVADFEAVLRRAAVAEQTAAIQGLRVALERAIDGYKGDLLPSCYDDWIVPERERLRQGFAGALERLILLLESQGEPRAATDYAQRLLRHDPLREETYCTLMRLHAASGDRAGVRRVYQTCATVLERELAVEPSTATRQTYQHLLNVELQARPMVLAPANTNLPVPLTSFVGRTPELTEVRHLLHTTRLLTLTGPGGTGKTRLGLEVARHRLEDYPNGVWLVELAPLADPMLVTQTVAATLGVREQPGRSLLDALVDFVRAKTLLLILDNCEHLIESCARLADSLLRAAAGLKILASSREALGIEGETAYRVPSLTLPDSRRLVDIDALADNDCVHLFVDRASAAYPPFRLTAKNAPAIAQIGLRLDGIPLAIELAAARIKVFPPEQIAARLDDRFRLLTGGSRTALERHQTLQALIDWSHNLLSEAERVLLRRLSVFAGGWPFEAIQAVCGDGLGDEVLDTLARLADKSLIDVEEQSEAAEGRYRLLETIRQYARDKLLEAGEAEQVRDRHLDYFMQFAQEMEPRLRGAEQLAGLERIETEHDNVRTALAWSLESGKNDQALKLAGALYYFWVLRGYFSEGQQWLTNALALSEREQSTKVQAGNYIPTHVAMAQRAKALYSAGYFHFATLNLEGAFTMVEESLRLWRELGDKWWTAVALELMGLLMGMEGDMQASLAGLEEGVSLARESEDPWPLALCLIRLGDHLKGTDAAAAHRFLEEGVAIARRVGDKSVLSDGLRELGTLYFSERDLTVAASITEDALAEARAIGSIGQVFLAMLQLVIISCLQNDPVKAKTYCFEVWALGKETASPLAIVFALLAFGLANSFGGEPQRGVRLLAVTDMIFRQRGVKWFVTSAEGEPLLMVYRQALDKAQAQLGLAAFEAAWAEGQQMTIEQAIALATEDAG